VAPVEDGVGSDVRAGGADIDELPHPASASGRRTNEFAQWRDDDPNILRHCLSCFGEFFNGGETLRPEPCARRRSHLLLALQNEK
jgi:hypothetical protein